MEYIRISYAITRAVLINGKVCGSTNTLLQVTAGQLHITLDGPGDFAPADGLRIRVRPGETNVLKPKAFPFSQADEASPFFSFGDQIVNEIAEDVADQIVAEIVDEIAEDVAQALTPKTSRKRSRSSKKAPIEATVVSAKTKTKGDVKTLAKKAPKSRKKSARKTAT
jgi:hypothetical protein